MQIDSFYKVYMILRHYHCWTTLTEYFKDYNLQVDVVTTRVCIYTEQLEKIVLIKASSGRGIFSFLKEFRRSDGGKCVLRIVPLNKHKNLILSIIRMKYRESIDSLLYEYPIIMQREYIYNGFEYWLLIIPSKMIIKDLESSIKNVALIKKLKIGTISPCELLAHFGKSEILTSKEKEIMLLSYYNGILDWSRRESLNNFSQMLKISKPVVLEHLRKGLKKIVEANIYMNYFDYQISWSEKLGFHNYPELNNVD